MSPRLRLRPRRRPPALPSLEDKRQAAWGTARAESLWQSLYGPRGPVVDGRTVLDLGCSWGYMLRFLAERFSPARLIGVDPGGAWLRAEHEWDWAALGERLEFHRGDLAEIEAIPDGSVDLILSSSVLQYLTPEGLEANLERCRALLRPGGEMILRTRCFTSSVGADLHREIDVPYVHLLYPAGDLEAWLRAERDRAAPYLNWLTASTYVAHFLAAGFELADVRRRMNSRAPHMQARVAEAFPWIGPQELGVAELDAHLVRAVAPEDLGGLGPIIGGDVADGPR